MRFIIRRMFSNAVSPVLFSQTGSVGVITLNRPKQLNALNFEMIELITPRLKSWAKDSSIVSVLIKGTGDKAFCAGGDVVALFESAKKQDNFYKEFFKAEYTLNYMIGTYSKPYISLWDGVTMGGGVGLSVHGKYKVATPRTVFAMPETAIGLFPDVGGGHFLPRLADEFGVYMTMTGHRVKGIVNYYHGIASHFCDSSNLSDFEVQLSKATTVEEVDNVMKQYAPSKNDMKPNVNTKWIANYFSGRTLDEIFNSLEQGTTSDDSSLAEWCDKQLSIMKKMSPRSMKISLEQLRRGKHLDLAQCLKMEYRLACRCMQDNDFVEGVRALLVDKDQNPKWKPDSFDLVTSNLVESFFEPMENDIDVHALSLNSN